MTRLILALGVTAFLTACGVDGSPSHPDPHPEPGITITGTASVGVVGGS